MIRPALRLLPLVALAAACAYGVQPAPLEPRSKVEGDCTLSVADQAWLDASMDAWDYTAHNITKVGRVKEIRGIFFDAQCMVTSDTAMNGGPKLWKATRHSGQVQVPNGPTIPAAVTSFAMGGEGRNLFVMSTPSVWRAANKSDNGLGSLETLMTAVIIHEANHVAQIPTYGKRMERLSAAHNLPEDFNDDSIQVRFEGKAEFASSVKRETELLFSAANAQDDAEARRLAAEALALMRGRQQQWFAGADAYLTEADDIWLTMEGSAQWAAYQWLIDPRGGAVARDVALASFSKGRWWSQVEGFAFFMALDRLAGDSWKRHAFGDGAKTGIEMLDEALLA